MNGRARERTLRPGLDAFSSAGRLLGDDLFDGHALRRSLLRALGLALLSALTILAAVLAERRLAGALVRPLSPWLLIVSGILLAACTGAIRLVLFPRLVNGSHAALRTPLVLVPTVLLILVGVSLSLRGSGTWSLGCFWLVLVSAEAWSLRPWWPGGKSPGNTSEHPRAGQPMTSAASLVERQQAKILDVGHVDADDEEDEAAETLPPDDVTQQMVRRRQADGTQALSGSLRIDFAGGERTATAHLAFCPSFDGPPEFSAAAMAGPGAQVRLVQVLAYGVRMEVKLDTVSRAAESVLVGFEASEKRNEG